MRRERTRRSRQKHQPPSESAEFPFHTPLFDAALQNEAFTRTHDFIQGLSAVASSRYSRPDNKQPVIWEHGSAKLYDYAPDASDRPAVLVIPSLINRSYILDITEDASFMRYLATQGMRPVLLDWGQPGEEEMEYGCADYISALALSALTSLREQHDGPIIVAGYCMGGVFALAMAQLAPMSVDGLVLLATPWDFSTDDSPSVALPGPSVLLLRQFLSGLNPIPAPMINLIFHMIDPWGVQQRYAKFPHLNEQQQAQFLATEHWLNDGVPLAQRVALETFVDWPQENALQSGTFKIGRRWLAPEMVKCPSFVVVPSNDRIVPASCATPLAKRLKRSTLLCPSLGHVSMVASERAKAAVWKPITQWVNAHF